MFSALSVRVIERKRQVRDSEVVSMKQTRSSVSLLRDKMEKNLPGFAKLKPANAKAPGTKATAFHSQWTICLETFSRLCVIDYIAFSCINTP